MRRGKRSTRREHSKQIYYLFRPTCIYPYGPAAMPLPPCILCLAICEQLVLATSNCPSIGSAVTFPSSYIKKTTQQSLASPTFPCIIAMQRAQVRSRYFPCREKRGAESSVSKSLRTAALTVLELPMPLLSAGGKHAYNSHTHPGH